MNKNRDWNKYLNTQNYSECQLVTAINAYYYLTGKTIKQNSKKYENLVDLVKARNGSAICIEKAWKRLGIKEITVSNTLNDFIRCTDGTIHLPLEYNIWHPRYGLHSTLIVNHNVEVDAVQVTNFKWETTLTGWIFREDLFKFENGFSSTHAYRLFGLK